MYWHGEYTFKGKKKLLPYRISDTDEEITISCGRCSACRINKSREWALRCVAESKCHSENYFLTLTIDDDHLEDNNGSGIPSCHIKDMQSWIKDVREWQRTEYGITGQKILYCSEYGDRSERPHYHCCFFGLHLDDLRPWTKSGNNWLYRSDKLESKWKKGQIMIGDVSAESAQYVAKYTMKNTDANKFFYDKFQMERPALRMSRRPGIGLNYFKDHMEQIMKDGGIYINGSLVPIPSSWKDKAKDIFIDLYDLQTQNAETTQKARESQRKHNNNSNALEARRLGIRPVTDQMHDRNKI